MREIEEMRASMPIGTYIELMHIAAVTGIVPTLDPETGQIAIARTTMLDEDGNEKLQVILKQANQLDGESRIRLMQYLVDKLMPNMKPADPKEMETPAQLVEATASFHRLRRPSPSSRSERRLAGQEGIEPPTPGFGDRCSAN